jgi:fibronectin-binding autotransporter adhesin
MGLSYGPGTLANQANIFTVGPQTIQTGADANKGLIVQRNSATQSANLIEVQDENNGILLSVGATGNLTVNGTTTSTVNQTTTGTVTITVTNANALAVGRQGATSPCLKVDSSVASSVTGLSIQAQIAGSGLVLAVVGGNATELLQLDAKGAGAINLGTVSTGNVNIGASGKQLQLANATGAVTIQAGGLTVSAGTTSLQATTATSLTGLTSAITPSVAGGVLIGTAALPMNGLVIGTAATNNFTITAAATGAARALTIPDPGGAATFAFTNPTTVQTLTGTTFDTAGASNTFKINGTTISAVTGTGSAVLSASPTFTGTPVLSTPTATSLTATSAASGDIGSALLPFANLWVGTAATNNFKFAPAATGAARIITIPDPGGAATLAFTNPTTVQTLTGTTFDTAGTSNTFKINGTSITAVTGTGSAVLSASPTLTGTITCATVTASGLITGTAGLTITGAAASINASSNFNTTINTGTSSGTVSIGNSSAGALTIASGAASTFTVTSNNLTISTATSGTLAVTSAGLLTLTGVGASVWTPGDGATIVVGTGTGLQIGTGTTQKIGFLGSSPIAQRANANEAAFTDNTGGAASPTFAAIAAGAAYAQADMVSVKNALAQIALAWNEVRTTLLNYGLWKGSA